MLFLLYYTTFSTVLQYKFPEFFVNITNHRAERKDKRENRREEVRLRRGLIENERFTAPLCKGSSAEGGEGLFFYKPPTAARFPNPSRRGLQVCFAHSQIPSTTSCSPSPYTGEADPLSARPASVLRTLANLSHKRGLVKINRAAGAPLLFDFLSSFFSPRSGLFFAIYNK